MKNLVQLDEIFLEAQKGKEIWKRIKKEINYYDDSCFLLILPSSDKKLEDLLLEEIGEYASRKYLKRGIVIHNHNRKIVDENNLLISYEMTLEEIQSLIKYYKLCDFTKNIIVAECNEPFANYNLVGKENIGIKDFVKDAILV